MKVISIKIEEELLDRIELYAMNHRISRNRAVKKAIQEMLEKEKGKERKDRAKIEKIRL